MVKTKKITVLMVPLSVHVCQDTAVSPPRLLGYIECTLTIVLIVPYKYSSTTTTAAYSWQSWGTL